MHFCLSSVAFQSRTCCANEIKRIFAGICVYQHSISVNQAFSFQNHPKNSLFIAQFPLNFPSAGNPKGKEMC
nr:MAG TPA: hypothetical protein [Caudoviricetes sp.]